jgi:hypothetical protein
MAELRLHLGGVQRDQSSEREKLNFLNNMNSTERSITYVTCTSLEDVTRISTHGTKSELSRFLYAVSW